ncbi:MAG TPA: HAD hydrolase-like protein [Anaerolineaceae bacterium]|jgi:phosphoglycolate phosphatase
MGYELIIFDFDGTLADSFPYVVSLFDEVADRHRIQRIDMDQIEMLRGLDAQQMMAYFHVPFWRMPFIARDVQSRMARDIQRIALFDGMGRVLQELTARGKQLAVVSSNSTANIRKVLGPQNSALIRYFEGGVTLLGKSPKIRKVMRRCGVQTHQTLLIGDEIRDIQAARQAQVDCGVVAWGYTRLDALVNHMPEIVFHTVEDMLVKID